MRWSAGFRNGAHISGAICEATHQGALKCARRNTPPVSRATRSTSDNRSISAPPSVDRCSGHNNRRPGHGAPLRFGPLDAIGAARPRHRDSMTHRLKGKPPMNAMTDIERPGTVNGINVGAVLNLVEDVA